MVSFDIRVKVTITFRQLLALASLVAAALKQLIG